ncbi:MAG: hypothetical protein KAI47_28025 [Deltaproteobacteria bacterium]|nr:hypothetical protein [Deltaproteobacteria bacterium]
MKDLLLISDLDSVLCHTTPHALRWVWDRFGVVVSPSAVRRYELEYAVAEALAEAGVDMSPEAVDAELIRVCWRNPQFYQSLAPRQEIWAALHAWQARGLPLQLMTRRDPTQRHATFVWLQSHGFTVDGEGALPAWPKVLLAAEKAARTREVCAHYRRVIFLEDARHHAEAIAAETDAEVWLVRQPWNKDPQHPRVERLEDAEITRRLAALSGTAI